MPWTGGIAVFWRHQKFLLATDGWSVGSSHPSAHGNATHTHRVTHGQGTWEIWSLLSRGNIALTPYPASAIVVARRIQYVPVASSTISISWGRIARGIEALLQFGKYVGDLRDRERAGWGRSWCRPVDRGGGCRNVNADE